MGEAIYTATDETRWTKDRMLVRLQHTITGKFLILTGSEAEGYSCSVLSEWKGERPSSTIDISDWESNMGGGSLWGLKPYSGVNDQGLVSDGSQMLLKNQLGHWLHAKRTEEGTSRHPHHCTQP